MYEEEITKDGYIIAKLIQTEHGNILIDMKPPYEKAKENK